MFTLVKWRDISSLLPAIKTRNKALGRCCRELSWPGGKATTYTALGMTKTIAITITNKHTHTAKWQQWQQRRQEDQQRLQNEHCAVRRHDDSLLERGWRMGRKKGKWVERERARESIISYRHHYGRWWLNQKDSSRAWWAWRGTASKSEAAPKSISCGLFSTARSVCKRISRYGLTDTQATARDTHSYRYTATDTDTARELERSTQLSGICCYWNQLFVHSSGHLRCDELKTKWFWASLFSSSLHWFNVDVSNYASCWS